MPSEATLVHVRRVHAGDEQRRGRDVRAEERDEHGQRGMEPLPAGFEVMPHLVDEDQKDEPDRELPAPDQRIAADSDEDRGELREGDAELEYGRADDDDPAPELA